MRVAPAEGDAWKADGEPRLEKERDLKVSCRKPPANTAQARTTTGGSK